MKVKFFWLKAIYYVGVPSSTIFYVYLSLSLTSTCADFIGLFCCWDCRQGRQRNWIPQLLFRCSVLSCTQSLPEPSVLSMHTIMISQFGKDGALAIYKIMPDPMALIFQVHFRYKIMQYVLSKKTHIVRK